MTRVRSRHAEQLRQRLSFRGVSPELAGAGSSFEAEGEPFVDIADASALAQIVRAGATETVRSDDGAEIDLMTS